MSRARRLPAIRICLPVLRPYLTNVGVVFLTATVVALATSMGPSNAAAASSSHGATSSRTSKLQARGRKPSSPRRVTCGASRRDSRLPKPGRSCAGQKSHPNKTKPSTPPTPSTVSTPRLGTSVSAQAPVNGGVLPSEATDPENGSPPNASGAPPLEAPLLETPVLEGHLTDKVSTATTLASSGNPSTVGEAIIYTATLNAIVATGTITFTDDGTTIAGCAAQNVGFGQASCTATSYATAGSHSIAATYSGDGNYLSSTSVGLVQTVNQAATTATVSSGTNPSQVGHAITYTATLDATNATGTVTFADSGTTITGCSALTISSGSATCTVAGYATKGIRSITATYSGDGRYVTSTSPALIQIVNAAATTTILESSANGAVAEQPVIYTATLSALAATGTVEFKEAGAPIANCVAQTLDSGSATCTVSDYATAGTHSVTATYSGDGNYLASTSSTLTQTNSSGQGDDQTAYRKTTTTTVSSSSNPSVVGEPVTYTATLSLAAATGTIEFKEAGATITGCAAQAVSAGAAKCTTVNSSSGARSVTATYSGDTNYAISTSPSYGQTAYRKTTTTTVSSSSNPSVVGEPVTYTATLSLAAATGTIEFKEAGATITGCAAQAVSAGAAKCTTVNSSSGARSVTATYSGDTNYAISTSPSYGQTAYRKTTTTTVSSSSNPSVVGEPVTYTATLSPAAATGTIEFKEAGATITGCAAQAVSAGAAKCTTVNSSSGARSVTATYSSDTNYAISTSPSYGQTAYRKTTTTTVSSSSNPSVVGEPVTYTATLSPAAATGTIEFKEAGATITGCAAQAVSAGAAKCTTVNSSSGARSVTATYSSDTNYAISTSPSYGQTAYRKTTTTTVSSSSNPSVVGEPVTYTATLSPAAATGTIEFKEAGATITGCAAQAVSAGAAKCTTVNSSSGARSVTATYSGDTNYAISTSPSYGQTAYRKTTTTTVSSSSNPSVVGEPVTYTATLSPAAATGTIEFKEAGATITGCAAQAVSAGAAKCTVAGYPSWSSYVITAAYSGDSSDLASDSSTFTQTVEPPVDSPGPFRFFSPSSFWNEELPADAPLDPSSAAVVGTFDENIAKEEEDNKGPYINTTSWSIPVYTVPADQPVVKGDALGSLEGARGSRASDGVGCGSVADRR